MQSRNKVRVGLLGIIFCIGLLVFGVSQRQILYGYIRDRGVKRDAYVYESQPDTNYGNYDFVRIGNFLSGRTQAYYYFDVSSLPGGWTEAAIVVHFDFASSLVDVGANITHSNWEEMNITWNNKPVSKSYRGHILNDGFGFNIPLQPENFSNNEITICLYGRGGVSDGYIQGPSREGAFDESETSFIRLTYDKLEPIVFTAIIMGSISVFFIIGFGIYIEIRRIRRNAEYRINKYITVKLEKGRTSIYVNKRNFNQCMRLTLNIPKDELSFHDNINSIDETVKLHQNTSNYHYQRTLISGHLKVRRQQQKYKVPVRQEFWAYCSNIQVWAEHDYDTGLLISEISFPLLRELVRGGDIVAVKVYKKEVATRLKSDNPSVVHYLLNQGYLEVFSSEEFRSLLESTDLIRNLSKDLRILRDFLHSAVYKFPELFKDILLKILKVSNGKKILISSLSLGSKRDPSRPYSGLMLRLLLTLKTAFEEALNHVDGREEKDIKECVQEIKEELKQRGTEINEFSGKSYLKIIQNMFLEGAPLPGSTEEQVKQKLYERIRSRHSTCAYCGKINTKNQNICEWCGYKKPEEEDWDSFSTDYMFYVFLIGKSASGPEELSYYTNKSFRESYKETIGVNFFKKELKYNDNKIRLMFHDVNEKMRTMLPLWVRQCNAAIIMFNINDSSTLNQIPDWVQMIKENSKDIPTILVGNRTDLDKPRMISIDEGIALAEKHNLYWYSEISTKTGDKVEELFEFVTGSIFTHRGFN